MPKNLYTKPLIPRVQRAERSRDELLASERAEEILAYLSTCQYASIGHVVLALLWETGARIGAAHSTDTYDVKFGARVDSPQGLDTGHDVKDRTETDARLE